MKRRKRPKLKPVKKRLVPRWRMSSRQYLGALKKLGLTRASQRTAALLGLGVRHCIRMGRGKAPVPRPVELLLAMYLKHGTPD